MSIWRPDPTFYPSPKMAMDAPPEKLAYVAMVNGKDNGRHDAMGVVDASNPAADSQPPRIHGPGRRRVRCVPGAFLGRIEGAGRAGREDRGDRADLSRSTQLLFRNRQGGFSPAAAQRKAEAALSSCVVGFPGRFFLWGERPHSSSRNVRGAHGARFLQADFLPGWKAESRLVGITQSDGKSGAVS